MITCKRGKTREDIRSIIQRAIDEADGDGLVITEADASERLAEEILQALEDRSYTSTSQRELIK